MAENTKIEWATHTFNPWAGCTKISPACDNCYAERDFDQRRHFVKWGPGQPRRRTSAENWKKPLRWNRISEQQHKAWALTKTQFPLLTEADLQARGFIKPRRPRVFCASLADVFDNEVPVEWRRDLFELIAATPHIDWLLLTKRIGNVRRMVPMGWTWEPTPRLPSAGWPPHVWLGVTVVNQAEADRDIPKLLAVPAARRFLSIEPMLGAIDIDQACQPHYEQQFAKTGGWHSMDEPAKSALALRYGPARYLDWVIVGGETGHGSRPMHPDWVRSLRDQCQDAGVPFFFKQWGAHDLSFDRDRDDPDYQRCDAIAKQPGRWINLAGGHGYHGERVHYARRVNKNAAGRLLDGREWNEVPT